MAKYIKYKFLSCEINHGTDESPDIEQIFLDAEIECKTQADYEANLPIAEQEAHNGEYTVVGDFDSVPGTEAGATWDELAAALAEGVNSV
jgi:hypothetical protein